MLIRQGATFQWVFVMVDSSDHVSGKTGLTPTLRLAKAGTSAAIAGSVAETDSVNLPGSYTFSGAAGDSDVLGQLKLYASAAGADPTDEVIGEVVAFDPEDAAALGLSRLDAAVSTRAAAATALSNADYTAARAAKLDNLDDPISQVLSAIAAIPSGRDFTDAEKSLLMGELARAFSQVQ